MTPKQNRFIAEYLKDLNATQAAIRAGYSAKTARQQGAENLSKPDIAAAVADAVKRRSERVEVTVDDVLRELLTFARTDIRKAFDAHGNLLPVHQMPEEVARAISGIENEEMFDWEGTGEERAKVHTGTVRKVKFWDKTKGLELLGKHLKMFTDKLEVGADDTFAEMLKKARERAKR
jgi:phage terminase small subunit